MYEQTAKDPATRLTSTRKMAILGIMCALAFIIMVVGRVPVVAFLKYDPKDVIITFAGFIYGPLSALLISVVVSFIEMFTVSDTGPIGLIMNILSTCAFACPAAFIYKKRHTLGGAVIGLATGIVLMTIVMILWNYLITPIFMGLPRADVAAMLSTVFLPFNLLKGGLNAALTLMLYKPLVRALRAANFLPQREGEAAAVSSKGVKTGIMIISAFVFATCVFAILVLQGIL